MRVRSLRDGPQLKRRLGFAAWRFYFLQLNFRLQKICRTYTLDMFERRIFLAMVANRSNEICVYNPNWQCAHHVQNSLNRWHKSEMIDSVQLNHESKFYEEILLKSARGELCSLRLVSSLILLILEWVPEDPVSQMNYSVTHKL